MVEGDSGPTNVELRIELDQVTSTVTVAVSATGGDAAAGVDFGAIASPVTITAGNIAATATIPITGDLLDELNETIVITLSSPSAGTSIGSTSTVTVTILDDDDPPDLAAGATASGSEDAGTIGVPLTLLASGLPISVRYTTTVGTAGSGDFTGVSNGFHLIAAGSTNSSIPISITNDSTYEGDETFAVEIGNATTTGATTAVTTTPTSTTVTIENDELPVASADSYGVNEDSTTTVAAPGLLSNDEGQGIAGVTRTVNLVTDVGTGTLALLTDGSFVYTTSPDFPFESTSATTTFVYNFLDGRFTSTNATATITVNQRPRRARSR